MKKALAAVAAAVGLILAAVAIADPGLGHQRPLRLHVSKPVPSPLALLFHRKLGPSLVRVDQRTLKARGKGLRLGLCGSPYSSGAFAFSGPRLALGGSFGRICVIGTHKLRLRAEIDTAVEGDVAAIAWIDNRLLAAVNQEDGRVLVAIDPATRSVVSRREVGGSLQGSAATPSGLVLLLGPANAIGPSELVLFAADGTTHVAALDRIPSGWEVPGAHGERVRRVTPALAVDGAGNRAFVVGAGGPVAEVDLRSMSVAYHDLARPISLLNRLGRWLEPAAEAKGPVEGPVREAVWLGSGAITVWGKNDHVEIDGDHRRLWQEPAGVSLIDTHDWTVRVVDHGATSATIADETLLTFSWLWDSTRYQAGGTGLSAYGPDGSQRFHVLKSRPIYNVQALGRRAFVWGSTSGYSVVDLRRGRVLRSFRGEPPRLLLP
jgi:hypothetical protein